MKFLVDESVEYAVVLYLRNLGFDTYSIAESSPSLEDKSVLSLASEEKRILITNDKDFGEIIYKLKIPHKGVILFRLPNEYSSSKIERLKILIEKFSFKLENHFAVITMSKVRFRK